MRGGLYGYLAEYPSEEALVAAARSAWDAGYRKVDAFSPYPSPELSEAVGHGTTTLPWVMFWSGLIFGLLGFYMQWYATVVSYPINVAGRPLGSTPSYMPITFEMTVLWATFGGLIGMLAANGLPRLHHPLFSIPSFVEHASQDGFFFCIEAQDELFNTEATRAFLLRQGATQVVEVDE